MKKDTAVRKIALTGILAAAAIALSFFENMFTAFLPFGMKIGLSNIIVMFSAMFCGFLPTLSIVLIKSAVILFTRGIFAFITGISGGIISACMIYFMFNKTKERFGFVGIGISGALTYNLAQLSAAYVIIGKPIFYYIPVFSVLSLLTGALTGLIIYVIVSRWLKIAII